MKRKRIFIFLFSVLAVIFIVNTNVEASAKEKGILTKENVQYFENVYENGKITKKELTKDKYEKKVKVEKEKRNKSEDEIIVMMVPCADPSVPCHPEEEGPENPDVYYTPEESGVVVDCSNSEFTLCTGHSRIYDFESDSDTSYTTLRTTVQLDPNASVGGIIKTEVTWDIMPTFRMEDFLSMSWNGATIFSDPTTTKATQFYYYKTNNYLCDDILGDVYCEYSESISTENHMKNIDYDFQDQRNYFESETNGVIFHVDFVDDWNSMSYNPDYPNNLVESQNDIYKYVITFETQFKIQESSYKDAFHLKFGSDYVHQYLSIDWEWSWSVDFNITEAAGKLTAVGSIVSKFDENRYSTIQFDFV